MLPVWLGSAAEERRLRAADAEFERVVGMGVGPLDPGTEEQEVGAGGGGGAQKGMARIRLLNQGALMQAAAGFCLATHSVAQRLRPPHG